VGNPGRETVSLPGWNAITRRPEDRGGCGAFPAVVSSEELLQTPPFSSIDDAVAEIREKWMRYQDGDLEISHLPTSMAGVAEAAADIVRCQDDHEAVMALAPLIAKNVPLAASDVVERAKQILAFVMAKRLNQLTPNTPTTTPTILATIANLRMIHPLRYRRQGLAFSHTRRS
jgi:hypothetical protein